MKLYKVTVYDEYTAEEYSKINKVIENAKKYLGIDISADQVEVPDYCYIANTINYKGFKITQIVNYKGIYYKPWIFESSGEFYEGDTELTLENAKKKIENEINEIKQKKIKQDKIIENARKYCKIDISSKDYLQHGFSDFYELKLPKYKDYLIEMRIYSNEIRFYVKEPYGEDNCKYSLDTNKDNVNVYNTIINKIKQEIDQKAEEREQEIRQYKIELEEKIKKQTDSLY